MRHNSSCCPAGVHPPVLPSAQALKTFKYFPEIMSKLHNTIPNIIAGFILSIKCRCGDVKILWCDDVSWQQQAGRGESRDRVQTHTEKCTWGGTYKHAHTNTQPGGHEPRQHLHWCVLPHTHAHTHTQRDTQCRRIMQKRLTLWLLWERGEEARGGLRGEKERLAVRAAAARWRSSAANVEQRFLYCGCQHSTSTKHFLIELFEYWWCYYSWLTLTLVSWLSFRFSTCRNICRLESLVAADYISAFACTQTS